MALSVPGYTIRPIAIANTVEEVELFAVQEESLPAFSRIIVEVPLDPSEDISFVAQQIQTACEGNNVPCWPENQGTYVFTENNTVYIAYMRPPSGVLPSVAIMPILLIIGIIAPIIMYFAIPGFAEIVNSIIMLMVIMLMMDLMKPMLETSARPARAAQRAPAAPREPIEQRISRRIESIADSVARTEKAFETSKSAGVSAVTSVVSDIRSVVGAIKGAPSTAMSVYEKSKAVGRLDVIDDRLTRYEEHLTPGQKANLEEERRIVEQMRVMYD